MCDPVWLLAARCPSSPQQAGEGIGGEEEGFFKDDQLEKNRQFLETLAQLEILTPFPDIPSQEIYATGGTDDLVHTLSLLRKNEESGSFVEFVRVAVKPGSDTFFTTYLSESGTVIPVPNFILDEQGKSVVDHCTRIVGDITDAPLFYRNFDPKDSLIVGLTTGDMYPYDDDSDVTTLEEQAGLDKELESSSRM